MFTSWLRCWRNQYASPARRRAELGRPKRVLLTFEALESRSLPSTYTVLNTNDSGGGSLRQMIASVNADSSPDVIQFNIPGSGVQTITLASPLPTITNAVTIDGYSQPGASRNTLSTGSNAVLQIALNGVNAGAGANGLTISASNSTIQGLVVKNFSGSGIVLTNGASNDVVQGNFIGTGNLGQGAAANGGDGIDVQLASNNTIGGTTPATANVIAGNAGNGITLGLAPGSNDASGLSLTAGAQAAGFGLATFVDQVPNLPISSGNFGPIGIGFTPAGQVLVDEYPDGVIQSYADSDGHAWGTGPQVGPALGKNGTFSIARDGSTMYLAEKQNDLVATLDPATGLLAPLMASGAIQNPNDIVVNPKNHHVLASTSNGIADIDPSVFYTKSAPAPILTTTPGDGLTISADGTKLYMENSGKVLGFKTSDGTKVFDSGTIQDPNTAQTLTADGVALGTGSLAGNLFINTHEGELVEYNLATSKQIVLASGGSRGDLVKVDPLTGTLLLTQSDRVERLIPPGGGGFDSGGGNSVVSTGNVVEGNYIGLKASGSAALPNGNDGIDLLVGAAGNKIGPGNVLSGNTWEGIYFSGIGAAGNTIAGNLIGTNATATAAVANTDSGIILDRGAAGNIIGPGNVIAGNSYDGIYLDGTATTQNVIQGNSIGINSSGSAIANGTGGNPSNADGVQLHNAVGNTIGGTAPGTGNIIAGNQGHGVFVEGGSSQNVVQGNFIGTTSGSSAGLGNSTDGIRIQESFNNTIGGTAAGAANVISGNGGNGITLLDQPQTFTPGNNDAGGLTLIPANAPGFTLSTFVRAIPHTGNVAPNGGVGPVALGFTPADTVLVGEYQFGQLNQFTDKDGQTFSAGTQLGVYGPHNAHAIARDGDTLYMTEKGDGALGVLDPNTGGITPIVDAGVLTAPLDVVVNPRNHHLFVSTGASGQGIVDVDPTVQYGTAPPTFVNQDADGLAISPDGATLYVAFGGGNKVLGFDTTSGTQVFDSGIVADSGVPLQPDGVALGTGALAGKFFINTHEGELVELDLATAAQTILATGGSRGDFVRVDPITGTLLLDQTDRVERLTPPAGGGFFIGGSTYGNVIAGNYIGTNVAGTAALANGGDGVHVISGAASNIIGPNNVISGNTFQGIYMAGARTMDNTIAGNLIGTTASGLAPLGNAQRGIFINGAPNNLVGGTTPADRNVISSNGSNSPEWVGILIANSGANGNVVQGNFIGLGADGRTPLPNTDAGVRLGSAANNNLVGGTASGAGNLIGANGAVNAPGNLDSILVDNWTGSGFAGTAGVGNSIRQNLITENQNGTNGILLSPGGNNDQAAPVLSSAANVPSGTTVTGSLTSAGSTSFALEFFASTAVDSKPEGQVFLGQASVTTNGAGQATFTVPLAVPATLDQVITATATNLATGDTSRFSSAVPVVDRAPPTSSVSALPPFGPATFTLTWSGSDGSNGSGIGSYDIYVSDNGGPFTPFLTGTTQISASFTGTSGHTYGFYSVATDRAGNTQPTPSGAQATMTIDTTPPTSSVSALPAFGLATFTLSWSGSDNSNGSGIAGYDIYVSDNGGAYTPLLTGTSQTSTTVTGTNGHTYGFYSIATDKAGNRQATPNASQATMTIDTAPPTSTIGTLPAFNQATFTLSWSGSDGSNGSGIASYDVYVSDNGAAFAPLLTATTQTSAPFNGTDGHTYGFYSIATDNVGNRQPTPTAAQIATTVDTVPPSSSVNTLPAISPAATFPVTWSGSDSSGIASYDVYVSDNGGPFRPFLTATTQTSAPYTGSDGHSYGFYSVATDNAGNRQPAPSGAQATTQVVIPNPTSTAIASDHASGAVYGQTVTVTATVTVAGAGGATATGKIQFLVDGTPAGNAVPLTQGAATLMLPALSAATHLLTANYTSDSPSFADSTTPAPLAQTVAPAPLTITADDQTMTYGGALPTLTVHYTGLVNGDTAASLTTAPTVATTATSAVGSYPINVAGATAANYAIAFQAGTLAITPAPLTITAVDQTKAYGAPLPTLSVHYTGFVNGDTAASLTTPPTVATPATAASSVGSYPIVPAAAADPNYTITFQTGTLTVTPAPLLAIADDQTKEYGAALPALTFHFTGFVNGDTPASLTTAPTATTTATTPSAVGSYPIKVSGATAANYTITFQPGTLTITPAPLTVSVDDATNVYGAPLPVLLAHYQGFVNGDTTASLSTALTFTSSATAASRVGKYPITATGATDPNYSVTVVPGTLTITPAPLQVQASDQTKLYAAPLPTFSVHYTGLVNGDTLATPPTETTTAAPASPVGSYPINVSGAADPNYAITFLPGTLTVAPAPLTVIADNQTMVYGAALPTLILHITGFVNGDTAASLTTPPAATTTATASSNAGSYPINVSGASGPNYTITFQAGTLTITPVPLTVTADDQTKAYGAPLPTLSVHYTGFVNGDTAASLTTAPTATTSATAASPVGSYPITPAGATSPNYTITFVPGKLTIMPVPLQITADDQTMLAGTALPPLTVHYTGLVNGDSPASLTAPPTVTTTASSSSPAGSYPLNVGAAAGPNYTITYVPGTLTILPAPTASTQANTPSVAPSTPAAHSTTVTPATTSHAHGITANPVFVQVGTKRLLEIEVHDANTGAVKRRIVSPFQGPAYSHIHIAIKHSNGAGSHDQVVITAIRGNKRLTRTFPG